MSTISQRSDTAAAYYGMTRADFDTLPGYKRLEMIEASEGKTYLTGQYDLLDDVQKDVTAAKISGWFGGVQFGSGFILVAAVLLLIFIFRNQLFAIPKAVRGAFA